MNVLICDDHAVFADSLALLVKASGAEVAAVTYRPQDAARILREIHVDVCILDVMFGDDSLFDYLADIVDLSPSTRFVVLTGRLDEETIEAGRAAGVVGFVEKVRSARDILTVIEGVNAGEVLIPECPERLRDGQGETYALTRAARRLASFLTPREREILSALVGGSDTAALARDLRITRATVRCHVQSVLTKMNVHSRLEAVTTAVRYGLLDPATGDWLI